MRPIPALALTAALLAGCSDFPQLDDVISSSARSADYPALLPIDQLLGGANDTQITDANLANLKGRVAGLQARAARLRRPVIDARTRAKMRAAINRHR